MKNKTFVTTEKIAVMCESVWNKTLVSGDIFTIVGEVKSFYKIVSPKFEDGKILCSLLKENLTKAKEQ